MATGKPRIEGWGNASGATTLSAGMTSVATTCSVVDASGLPSNPDFKIRINDEYLTVTAISGNTLTVVRAADGSTNTTHSLGDAVEHVLTGEGISRAFHDAYGYSQDGYPLNRVHNDITDTVLTASDFTWLNQGTATCVDADDGGLLMTLPSEGVWQVRGKYLSAPATPYWATAFVQFGPGMARFAGGTTGSTIGIFFRESSTGKLYLHQLRGDVIHMIRATTTSFVADVDSFIDSAFQGVWLRIGDNGSDVFGEVSLDGIHWEVCFNEVRNSYMAGGPDQVGFYAQSGNAAAGAHFYFKTFILAGSIL